MAAALSPSLNSMASATLRDFYLPYFRPQADEPTQMRVARAFTVFWGVCQIARGARGAAGASALEAGLAALGYASGPTVGAFLLGLLTTRATTSGTLVGMLGGLLVSLATGLLGAVDHRRSRASPGPGTCWSAR